MHHSCLFLCFTQSTSTHTLVEKQTERHTPPLFDVCVTQKYLQHGCTMPGCTSRVSQTSLSFNRNSHFFTHHLSCDRVHAVYRHNIWQSERSSGGYCVGLCKWLTAWEGWKGGMTLIEEVCSVSKRLALNKGKNKMTAGHVPCKIFSASSIAWKLSPKVCKCRLRPSCTNFCNVTYRKHTRLLLQSNTKVKPCCPVQWKTSDYN